MPAKTKAETADEPQVEAQTEGDVVLEDDERIVAESEDGTTGTTSKGRTVKLRDAPVKEAPAVEPEGEPESEAEPEA